MKIKHKRILLYSLLFFLISLIVYDSYYGIRPANRREIWISKYLESYKVSESAQTKVPQVKLILKKAKELINSTKVYDPSYVKLKYPLGDVPKETGVCADIVIRSLRVINIDLQKEIFEDKSLNMNAYPAIWYQTKADFHIDHRRVPNIMTYLQRHKTTIDLDQNFIPGDIIAYNLGRGITHIGIASNKLNKNGEPYLIHHIGGTPREADELKKSRIIGHYRVQ